jgi:hypothetical protein
MVPLQRAIKQAQAAANDHSGTFAGRGVLVPPVAGKGTSPRPAEPNDASK